MDAAACIADILTARDYQTARQLRDDLKGWYASGGARPTLADVDRRMPSSAAHHWQDEARRLGATGHA